MSRQGDAGLFCPLLGVPTYTAPRTPALVLCY